MTKSSFHKLLLGSVLMLLPFAVQAQVVLKNWTIEDHSGKVKILVSSDTLEITAPDGLTLWYNQRLTGDYEIGYRVKMLMQGGKYDRLSDLNCFWGANDPEYPDNLFARSEWRNGIFQRYKTLSLFYVGYGGNHNATTTLGIMKKSPKYRLSVLRTQGIFANDSVSAYVPHVLSQTLQTHTRINFTATCVFFPFDLKVHL